MIGLVLRGLKEMLGKKAVDKNMAVFVDGPNILRKELGTDLDKIKKKLSKFGKIKVAKVFLDQFASDKLIEAVTNQGFEAVIVPSDVDVALAVDATEYVFNPHIDIIVVVSRDSDFKPLITKAKAHGKETVVAGCEPDFSTALRNSADHTVDIRE
ncbi:MAG: TIGR00288 family NYN domain-containing protein [Candidatus Micrarchaeia archaeon]